MSISTHITVWLLARTWGVVCVGLAHHVIVDWNVCPADWERFTGLVFRRGFRLSYQGNVASLATQHRARSPPRSDCAHVGGTWVAQC